MKRPLIASAVLAAALFGGGIAVGEIAGIPGTSAASPAATTTQTAPATSTTPTAPSTGTQPFFPAHGSAAHENAEQAVTGSAATQAQAAAVKSVGSGTAGAVTSDFRGGGYEVTVTKADGSTVEVHLDSSFNVQAGHGGDGDNDGPGAVSATPGA